MKRLVLLLTFLCPMGFIALNAQSSSIFIGATGGANLSKFKFTEDLKELYPASNSLLGLNGGVTIGFEVQNFTLHTGLQYIQKGSEYQTDNFEDEQGTGFYSATEKLHYLSIPLLIGYRKYLGDRAGVSIAAGPSFNFGLTGKIDDRIEYFGSDEVDVQNYRVLFGSGLNEDYRGVQMGFQVSPGLFFVVNDHSKVTFNVTWDSGTADAFNPRYKDANDFFDTYKGDQRNHSTIFTIGYEYHFTFNDRY